MKFQYLIENSTMERVNERMKKIELDSEKKEKQFFRNEVLTALNQLKERTKK